MCFVRRARKSEVPVKIDENLKLLISNFDACAWFRRCVLFFSPLASCFSLLTSSPCVECARAPGARRFRVIFRTSFEVFKFSHSVDYVSGYDPNFSGHSLHDSAHSAGPDLEGSAKKNFFGQKRPDRVGARFRCPPCLVVLRVKRTMLKHHSSSWKMLERYKKYAEKSRFKPYISLKIHSINGGSRF